MSDQRNGGIVWTEQTWNPLRGCTRVSAGCINCYAESMAARFCGAGQPYEGTINPETKRWSGNIKLVPEHLQDPLRWKRPRMVFVNSMSDLFHESVPDEFIDKVFAVMALASQHIFQVLTKRPERMRIYMNSPDRNVCIQNVVDDMESWDGNFIPSDQSAPLIKEWPLPNVWLGTTVENQEAADERIPLLLQTPATVRWISAEPMVGSVDLTKIPHRIGYGCSPCSGCDEAVFMDALSGATYCKTGCDGPNMPSIDWVVCGGESGTNARPMHPEWARSLRDQCAALACRSCSSNGASGHRTKHAPGAMKAVIFVVVVFAICKVTDANQMGIFAEVMQPLHASGKKPQAACWTACCMTDTQRRAMSDRASNLHQARVYLTESKRRGNSPFAFLLLTWAGNARRRAMALKTMPAQGYLFGGAA